MMIMMGVIVIMIIAEGGEREGYRGEWGLGWWMGRMGIHYVPL